MSNNDKDKTFFEKIAMLKKIDAINKVLENKIKTDYEKKEHEKAIQFYIKIQSYLYYKNHKGYK
jgi:hypothetical protein